jgi:hypothetical protein
LTAAGSDKLLNATAAGAPVLANQCNGRLDHSNDAHISQQPLGTAQVFPNGRVQWDASLHVEINI